jgi:hypothetical protein
MPGDDQPHAPLFLTPEQVQELTGYRQFRAQIRWLQQAGLRHWVRADGRPVVPVAAIEQLAAPDKEDRGPGPDFSQVRPVKSRKK